MAFDKEAAQKAANRAFGDRTDTTALIRGIKIPKGESKGVKHTHSFTLYDRNYEKIKNLAKENNYSSVSAFLDSFIENNF